MAKSNFSGRSGSGSRGNSRNSKRSFGKGSDKTKSTSSKEERPFSKFRKDDPHASKDKARKSGGSFSSKRSGDRDSKFQKDDNEKPKRSYDKSFFSKDKRGDKKHDRDESSYGKDKYSSDRKPKFDKEDSSFKRNDKYKSRDDDRPKRSFNKDDKGSYHKKSDDDRPKRSFSKDDKGSFHKKRDDDRPKRSYSSDDKGSFHKKHDDDRKKYSSHDRDDRKRKHHDDEGESKRFKKDDFKEGRGFKSHDGDKKKFRERSFKKKHDSDKPRKQHDGGEELVRLNKYLANAGISSRREADTLILSGTVKVNGVVVDTLGYKVKPTDVVSYGDSAIKNEKKIYLLLNKPKDFITTTDDPQERRTVMELVRPACKERIYPVGRLDRNTTGLLLFTNDGDLATKLMHPKHEIRKVYHVTISKPMRGEDYKAISEGLMLEDGPVKVDDIAFVGEGKKEIGLEIHSGRNRIVRRIFEHLGYDVLKLDRVSYAGLTKKDLPRGKYRFLTEREIAYLKMLG